LDSDRRPANHDTINELANVSLRSSAVRDSLPRASATRVSTSAAGTRVIY
jgi:hypothetical protein